MSEIECKICGNKFTPYRTKKYEVVIPSTFGPDRLGEAFDCPHCGCQHVVNYKYRTPEEYKRGLVWTTTK